MLALAALHNIPGGGLAEAGNRDERREEPAVPDEEFCGMRCVKVNIVKRESAQIEFIADFERRQQIFFLVRMIRIGVDALDVLLHSLDAMCHHHGVEAVLLTAAVEIGRIKRQRVMYLEPRDAEGHHDIGRSVRLREEVFDLFAGFDVPFRHLMLAHLLHNALRPRLALVDRALSDGLHEFEGTLLRQTALDEIEHDIVAAADGLIDRGRAAQDQVLRVAEPNIRAVGEAGKADERIELRRLGVHEHPAGEDRAEFRNADCADLRQDLVMLIAEHLA